MQAFGKEIRIEGGLIRIARLEGDKYEFVDEPETLLYALRESGQRIDLFTFMQKVSDPSPRYPYPMVWDNLAVVPVSTFENWWTKQIDGKTRNMVRRAEKKGITAREVPFDDAMVQGISAIYNESPTRQGKPFRHYGKDIETVRRISATFLHHSVFIGAFLDETLIGFAKLVSDEHRGQAGLMHIVSMNRHRDKAPTNALIAQAVRTCAERGIPYLVYSNFAYGKKQSDSLSEFKENNGFRRVDLPRYYIPLTIAGRIAVRCGLHQDLTERMPEPVLRYLRKVRNQWYARKHVPSPGE